jgi:hypothetical protein
VASIVISTHALTALFVRPREEELSKEKEKREAYHESSVTE